MKIYRKLVIDKNGIIIEANFYDYIGPISQCGIFEGESSPPPPPPPPPPPTLEDPEIEAARAAERVRLRRKKGRRATILTSPLGLQEKAPVQKQPLLGR